MPESINYENWPIPDSTLQDAETEHAFDTLLKTVALTYSARQTAQLKRRWPLQKAVLVAPKNKLQELKNLEDLFLELANVKTVEYHTKDDLALIGPLLDANWVHASEGDLDVHLNKQRDEKLQGEGVMRDIARRVQALRKKLGFTPTDILDAVHLAELDAESTRLLEPYLTEMAELVRTKKVHVHKERLEVKAEWHEYAFDDKKVYVAIA